MNTFLHKQLKINLTQNLNIQKNQHILLALSGGADSLCLLKLLKDIQILYKLQLGLIYIDHQQRHDSIYNSKHIINIIKEYKLQSYIYQIKQSKYSENQLRRLRYQIFLKTANKYNYSYIATAHHNDDKIETCLQNLIRGSSLDGLNSLKWSRFINPNLQIIRPILNFKKSDILWFCKYYNLPIWSDYTNTSYIYKRNRIRQELIPYLKLYLNNDIEENINNFLNITNLDIEYIRQNTLKIYQAVKHPKLIALNYQILFKQHKALQIRVLKLFFYHNFKLNISFVFIKDLIKYLSYDQQQIIKYQHLIIKYNSKWLYIC
uniref:tRNA(Ile)-lysidine synthase, chloroplastic n=1 Tax=Dichotomaria marginata TaxID=268567 RepID=A0A1G4NSA9_9FLOR|nr:tRNA Ile-lysidine synthetase [Dichotomaria marginata]SCW21495.1 tRNA Ile-lysidine synthetase [Dichotomaria marginata]